MRTNKELLRKARAVRKLISNLVQTELTWKASYIVYSSWETMVELTVNEAKLMSQSLSLIGVKMGMGWFDYTGKRNVSVYITAENANNTLEVVLIPLYFSRQTMTVGGKYDGYTQTCNTTGTLH